MEIPTHLSDYVNRADSSFQYTVESAPRRASRSVTRTDIQLVSQTWQGAPWAHRLTVFAPESIRYDGHAILTIGADGPCSAEHEALGCAYAESAGVLSAFLYDVPNQPLMDGRIEDALIAYTLLQYLDTEDPSWPLLFPMVRSAMAAMIALCEYSRPAGWPATQRFVVTGASKRGWTTWLTAVCDSRVCAIAPVVYDNLKLFAQMPHQLAVFESYSDQISDYAESGVLDRMTTPEGYRLAGMIDPYTYRDTLSLPKLIINGSNDPYWATDAINLYWDELSAPRNVLYVPNQPHHLTDVARISSALIELTCRTAESRRLPQLTRRLDTISNAPVLSVEADEEMEAAACWVAESGSLDFRLATWRRQPMDQYAPTAACLRLEPSARTNYALFAELVFGGSGGRFPLSTPVTIVRGGKR